MRGRAWLGPSRTERSWPLTDLNDDPYRMMYFPTYRDTRKVEGVERDTNVLIVIHIIVVIMAQYLLLVK